MSEGPTSDWTWINAAADRFERAWKAERRGRASRTSWPKPPSTQRPRCSTSCFASSSNCAARRRGSPDAEEYRRDFQIILR